MSDHFEPSRLTAIRSIREMTGKELAERVGVTPGAISHFEKGRTTPSPEVVRRMGSALQVPPRFFEQNAIDDPDESPTFPRARARTPKRVMRRLKYLRDVLMDVVETCEQEGVVEAELPTLNRLTDVPPVEAAHEIRYSLSLRLDEPIWNTVEALEELGVWVHELGPEESEQVDAFATWSKGRPVVFMNHSRVDPWRQRFNAGHELRHLLSHDDLAPGREGQREQERDADQFAAEFLVPLDVWLSEAPRRGATNPWTYMAGKAKWGASVACLIRRSFDGGLLSERQYRYTMMRYSQLGWRRGEPTPRGCQPPIEQPQLFKDFLQAAELSPSTLSFHFAWGDVLTREVLGLAGDETPSTEMAPAPTHRAPARQDNVINLALVAGRRR